jgi:hypothetical protein
MNAEVHYRMHNRPLIVSILSQINPIHVPKQFIEDPF